MRVSQEPIQVSLRLLVQLLSYLIAGETSHFEATNESNIKNMWFDRLEKGMGAHR